MPPSLSLWSLCPSLLQYSAQPEEQQCLPELSVWELSRLQSSQSKSGQAQFFLRGGKQGCQISSSATGNILPGQRLENQSSPKQPWKKYRYLLLWWLLFIASKFQGGTTSVVSSMWLSGFKLFSTIRKLWFGLADLCVCVVVFFFKPERLNFHELSLAQNFLPQAVSLGYK